MPDRSVPPLAVVGDRLLTGLQDVTSDLAALDGTGAWAVVLPFAGEPVCARFAHVRPARPWTGRPWVGVDPGSWRSSLDQAAFEAGVDAIREAIARGDVYQVNLTRVLAAPLPAGADVAALGAALAAGNPAPFSAVVRIPSHDLHVASASPERFLQRDGTRVWSSPIKGTAATPEEFLAKDEAENVMIVDLVRNDLGRVCEWGSVHVPSLCTVEEHPGLAHLVSTVEGHLRPGLGWAEAIGATFPPGSVTGAPKVAALEHIAALEQAAREVYCGAVGWVDADTGVGALNVAIRTFWFADGEIRFGTGGAITWDSDPAGEWAETELKARRLLQVAAGPTGHTGTLMSTWVWTDGVVSTAAAARIGALDHGVTVGDGVFETCMVVDGTPFALTRHLERLRRSAQVIGLDLPWGDSRVRSACARAVGAALVDPANAETGISRLRITITGGPGPLGSDRADVSPTLIVAAGPGSPWPATTDVATVAWTRNERSAVAGAKTTSYAENVVALAEAKRLGASEAILANSRGVLAEGTGSNVFLVVDGQLCTPSLSSGCLAGITRALVVETVAVVERDDLTLEHLRTAPEAFLTSSTRDVHPIARVDGVALADGPGPLTTDAATAFAALRARTLDP